MVGSIDGTIVAICLSVVLAIILGLIMLIPELVMGGIQALNVRLWLKLNYPNHKKWPKSARSV